MKKAQVEVMGEIVQEKDPFFPESVIMLYLERGSIDGAIIVPTLGIGKVLEAAVGKHLPNKGDFNSRAKVAIKLEITFE